MRFLYFFFFFFSANFIFAGTIKGKITDTKGESLPFANVYIKGTSIGTTSNLDGKYILPLENGTHEIVFQYVGYQLFSKKITINETTIELNAQLEEAEIKLSEVVVSASEDPAYRVIRAAIKKRPYYKNLVQKYACDVYIKGSQKIEDVPVKMFGQDLGDMDGLLDTNRQGIVYLSESVSKLYYQRPNQYKEVMVSSKISGDNNGFSFNQARGMDFNFYENSLFFNRALVSPIADNALDFYKYHLEGYFIEGDYKINKIEVTPKRSHAPAFSGYIYIIEDLWNIHSTDLIATKKAVQIDVLDTIRFKQVHLPVQSPDTWMIFNQTIQFKISVFGFGFNGTFVGVFKNYNLGIDFPKGFFSNEVMKIEEGSNQKTTTYWDSIRPVPLTNEETIDYIKKDSINTILTSQVYLDSIDKEDNQFKLINLLTGYTYNRSVKQTSFKIKSPLGTVQHNLVQGFALSLTAAYKKSFNEIKSRWFEIEPTIQYGISDEVFRGGLRATYNFNKTKYNQLTVSGGQKVQQFNAREPVCTACNTWLNLLYRTNHIRLYQNTFAKINYQQELTNGIFFDGGVEYSQRDPLVNTTEFYIVNLLSRDPYDSNIPSNAEYQFQSHEAVIFNASFRLRYKQRYISYPNQKVMLGSKLPDLWVHYEKGISVDGSTDYDKIKLNVRNSFQTGVWGISRYNIEVGAFLNNSAVPFMNYFHFDGNRTFLGKTENYYRSFFVLPYYDRSTNNSYAMLHYEHDFNGILMSKVPLLKRLGWTTVIGTKAIYTSDQAEYAEINLGINKIGWGVFRLFRVDVAASLDTSGFLNYGVVFGYFLPF